MGPVGETGNEKLGSEKSVGHARHAIAIIA